MTLIVTWLWQGLAIATGTPSAPDLTSLDTAGALMLPPIPDGVVACAVAIWAMTAAVGALRLARSCRALGRLTRASSPFDRSREARLPLWVAARDGGHRAAELRTADCMTGACALGFGRPVILVSRSRPFLYTRRQSCRERFSASVNRAPSVSLLVEDPLCVCS